MGNNRVLCVVGLGLIGGSLAASVRTAGARWRVRAVDRRRSALDYALKRGLIDEAAPSLEDGVAGAHLVVLATPVGTIPGLLRRVAPLLGPEQVVTDVGSTKATIVAAARRELPAQVAFVGGHPVAGTERSGVESAEAGLFQGRSCVLTPVSDTPAAALDRVAGLWRELGAQVVLLEPEVHDRVFARLSHLPHAVAYCLVHTVATALPARQLALGGGALRDLTRVAQSPPGLWKDICLENREALAGALDEFVAALGRLREAVAAGDGEAVEEVFRQAAEVRSRSWML
ncbi:MAG: prephenate dehydrogenase/arogenate dehydrogenase family protein [Deferrisomatales bacterium]